MATGRSPSSADRPPSNPYRKALEKYYATLQEFEFQRSFHEGAVSSAFQNLLADTARPHGWTLIPQLGDKSAGKDIRPDGTLKDAMYLVRGHWEAKDTADDLLDEIAKKKAKGYPLTNIIFEDTRPGRPLPGRPGRPRHRPPQPQPTP